MKDKPILRWFRVRRRKNASEWERWRMTDAQARNVEKLYEVKPD